METRGLLWQKSMRPHFVAGIVFAAFEFECLDWVTGGWPGVPLIERHSHVVVLQ